VQNELPVILKEMIFSGKVKHLLCVVWSYHDGITEGLSLLGCYAVSLGKQFVKFEGL